MISLAIVSPLLIFVSLANVIVPKELAPVQQLQKRNPYYGGYALQQGDTNCPSDTQTCATGFCCPLNTWCSEDSNQPYCCPTPDDCGTTVDDAPTCANPSWTMYMDAYAFCCAGDTVGIQGEQCQPKSLTFSANLYAATSSQANTALPPTTRASSSVTGTDTLAAGSTAAASTGTGSTGNSSKTGNAATATSLGSTATATSSTSAKSGAAHGVGGSQGMILAAIGGCLVATVFALL